MSFSTAADMFTTDALKALIDATRANGLNKEEAAKAAAAGDSAEGEKNDE
jgi:hypothetical protein